MDEWYLGRKECGCAVATCKDDKEDPKWTARCVADMIKDGLSVTCVPVEVSRREIKRCECDVVQPSLDRGEGWTDGV